MTLREYVARRNIARLEEKLRVQQDPVTRAQLEALRDKELAALEAELDAAAPRPGQPHAH